MKWYRSWPDKIPPGRAYVVDSMTRLVMNDADYNTVQPWPDDEPGFCMLEWDIALAREERERFVELVHRSPNRVLVAPYYKTLDPLDGPICIHRVRRAKGDRRPPRGWGDWSPLPRFATRTDLFGFGCIYLPLKVVQEYKQANPHKPRFDDTSFSVWYRARYGEADVTWDVHPQHLHGD